MRILAVHPGADYATADVHDGLVPALQAQGVEIAPYALSNRIARAASWLYAAWESSGADPTNRPTDADVAYQASVGALERALRLKVDWVLVISAMFFHPDALILLRRAGVKVAGLLTESPYQEEAERRLLQWVDVAWTNERTCVDAYRQVNPNVFYLPHAYDPARHAPKESFTAPRATKENDPNLSLQAHDVVFIGTPFPERVELLEAIDWTGIDLGLYGLWDEGLAPDSKLRQYVHEGIVPNEQAAALYRRAKIGLNLYRSSRDFESQTRITTAESLNPRALELAACQVFQISTWREEVDEVFWHSVPTFRRPEQLQTLLRRYLDSPDRRASMALASRACVAGRTFDQRAEQIINDLARVSAGIPVSA